LLTTLLLDKIKASKEGRIVNLSSGAHKMGKKKLVFEDLHCEKSYVPWDAYSASKLSNIYFTRELAKRLEKQGVSHVKTCSLHPGVVRTELGRYMYEGRRCRQIMVYTLIGPIFYFCTKTPWQGSQTQLSCCLMPFGELENGKYYSDCKVLQEKLNSDWEKEAE
jgi:NAD(P)-dependent dehydrogenase (short-subunit alcohol dehydrogenase family)